MSTEYLGMKLPSTSDNIAEQINVDTPANLNKIDASLKAVHTITKQTIAESYNSALSIPSTAKRGKLDVKLKGMSAINVIKNGNFADGTTGWTSTTSTSSVANKIATNTGNGASASPFIRQTAVNLKLGNKYYFYAKTRATNSSCNSIAINDGYGGGGVQSSPVLNQWYELSAIKTVTQGTIVYITHAYVDAATANNKSIELDGNVGIFAIDMTALGIESYTEQQMLEMVRNGYFDGLQGASNITVKSTGKNLFDGKADANIITAYETRNDLFVFRGISGKNGLNAFPNIKFKPNTQYTFSGSVWETSDSSNVMLLIVYTDKTSSIFFYPPATETPFTFTSTAGKSIDFLSWTYGSGIESIVSYKNFQIEEGTVATSYEEYKGTEVTYKTLDGQPITLHRLPNGVRDEVDENGKLIKRIGEKSLVASDITSLLTSNVNNDLITIPFTNLLNSKVGVNDAVDGAQIIPPFNEIASGLDSTSVVGSFYTSTTNIVLMVAKGTYPNLAAAQAALTGYKVLYQLAQPQILDTNAIPLVAEPNGSVFITPTVSPQPSVELSYPINLGAVVDGLIEGQKEIGERIDNLDKSQWITATLQNGWTGTLQYRKNQIGQIEIKGNITGGTVTLGTTVCQLPSGFYPAENASIPTFNASTNSTSPSTLMLSNAGLLSIRISALSAGSILRFCVALPTV